MKAYGIIRNKSMVIWVKPFGETKYQRFTNWEDAKAHEKGEKNGTSKSMYYL